MMDDKNITKMDVEFYLLNREYNELTTEEHAIVKEYVESEQEFNEMKAVLMGAGNFFKEEKELEPNPSIKAALLKEFDKQQPAGAYWLNGMFVSLFPKEKKLYQKPGMQLIGFAASVLLIVTIAFNSSTDLNNTTLAQNDEVKTEEETISEVKELDKIVNDKEQEVLKGEKGTIDLLVNEVELKEVTEGEEAKGLLMSELELDGLAESKDEKGDLTIFGETSVFTYDSQPLEDASSDFATTIEQEVDNRNRNNVSESADKNFRKETAKKNESIAVADEKLVISATTTATVEIAEEMSIEEDAYYYSDNVSVATGGATAPSVSGNVIDLPVNSRSLAEDADLIGILYTAM